MGPEPPCWAPLPPPAVPILPILSLGASGAGPGGSAFSSGRSGQTRSGLLLLGGGRGCFWRRMYSTEGRAGSEPGQGPPQRAVGQGGQGLWVDPPSVGPGPRGPDPDRGSGLLLTVLVVLPLYLVVVVQRGWLGLLLRLWGKCSGLPCRRHSRMPLPRPTLESQPAQGQVDIGHSPDWRSGSVSPPGPTQGLGRAPPATQSPQAGGQEAHPDHWLYREPPARPWPCRHLPKPELSPRRPGPLWPSAPCWHLLGLESWRAFWGAQAPAGGHPNGSGPNNTREEGSAGARGTDPGHWRANTIHKAAKRPLPRGGSHPEGAPTNGYAPDNSELPEPTLSERPSGSICRRQRPRDPLSLPVA